MPVDHRALAAVTSAHHGVADVGALVEAGVSSRTVRRWVEQGRLVRPQHGIVAVAGIHPAYEADVEAAVRAAGPSALASHRSAARLWDFGDHLEEVLEVTVPRSCAPTPRGVIVHRVADVATARPAGRRGVAVTDPLRTLVDLGAVVPLWAVQTSIDVATYHGLVTIDAITAEMERLAGRGRAGVGVMRRALAARGVTPARRQTPLEARLLRVVLAAGLPHPELEWEVGDYRIDLAYPPGLLGIEGDSDRWHSTPEQLAEQAERQNWLQTRGWLLLRYRSSAVARKRALIGSEVRAALLARCPALLGRSVAT